MRAVKTVIGLMFALIPVLYCGGLFFFFLNTGGSVQDAVGSGLGPTLLGIGAVGLLFCVPVVIKILRAVSTHPRRAAGAVPDPEPGTSEFDPDAALARYLARKSGAAQGLALSTDSPAPRPSFGRKIA